MPEPDPGCAAACLYAFDLLQVTDEDLRGLEAVERRADDSNRSSYSKDRPLTYPMTGMVCCARAEAGRPAATPPRSAMNSRRLI